MAKKQADQFPCSQNGCEYVGFSERGLIVHTARAHKNNGREVAVVEAVVEQEEPAMFFTREECEALWDAVMGDPFNRAAWQNRYNAPHTTFKRALIELYKGMKV